MYVRDRVRGPRWSDKDGDTMVEGKWRERERSFSVLRTRRKARASRFEG